LSLSSEPSGERIPENTPAMEVLISDLQGNWDALQLIVAARPQVINHNVETVPRLYPEVRPEADFARSVELLRRVKKQNPDILTKSGIMVGLGETEPEVLSVMATLREAGCNLLTIGQYLAPSPKHHPVIEYIHPDQFLAYKKRARRWGLPMLPQARWCAVRIMPAKRSEKPTDLAIVVDVDDFGCRLFR